MPGLRAHGAAALIAWRPSIHLDATPACAFYARPARPWGCCAHRVAPERIYSDGAPHAPSMPGPRAHGATVLIAWRQSASIRMAPRMRLLCQALAPMRPGRQRAAYRTPGRNIVMLERPGRIINQR